MPKSGAVCRLFSQLHKRDIFQRSKPACPFDVHLLRVLSDAERSDPSAYSSIDLPAVSCNLKGISRPFAKNKVCINWQIKHIFHEGGKIRIYKNKSYFCTEKAYVTVLAGSESSVGRTSKQTSNNSSWFDPRHGCAFFSLCVILWPVWIQDRVSEHERVWKIRPLAYLNRNWRFGTNRINTRKVW